LSNIFTQCYVRILGLVSVYIVFYISLMITPIYNPYYSCGYIPIGASQSLMIFFGMCHFDWAFTQKNHDKFNILQIEAFSTNMKLW
jgi:hypothetical protein